MCQDKIMGIVSAIEYPVEFPVTKEVGKRPDT